DDDVQHGGRDREEDERAHGSGACRRFDAHRRIIPGASIRNITPGPLAHRVEQGTFNPKAPGSSPGRPTALAIAQRSARCMIVRSNESACRLGSAAPPSITMFCPVM